MTCLLCVFCVFFFKQKTAYDMRISDWSSDVCSSDLREHQRQGDVVLFRLLDQRVGKPGADIGFAAATRRLDLVEAKPRHGAAEERRGLAHRFAESGRASCRERGCQYV